MDVSPSGVSLEHDDGDGKNETADPSTSNLLALSNLYGVAADELLKSVNSELKQENGSGRKEEK